MSNVPIGKLITDEQHRDAIHVAIAPVVAMEQLMPGDRINFWKVGNTTEVRASRTPIGIVDPFLEGRVETGQSFWMFLFPNTITSLRHEWTHPALEFSEDPASIKVNAAVENSKEWIEQFAKMIGKSVPALMAAAKRYQDSGESTRDNSQAYGDVDYSSWAIFWVHFGVVTGTKVEHSDNFFTCSC